jgi:hypothetical protein
MNHLTLIKRHKINITKIILSNWKLKDWKNLSIHYKIYIRNNYKNTILNRIKRSLKHETKKRN